MSAHILLNLMNKLRKRDEMRCLLSILSHFRNKFNKFNNTGAPMLDSIYHMKLFCLILFFTSTQQSFSYAGRSSWVEPVLS